MRIKGPGSRSFRRIAGTIACALVTALIVAPAAWASTPFIDIHSAGPLSDIYIGNDLGCQVRNGGFSSTEFFPNAAGPGDCGTFFNTGSDNATSSSRDRTSRTTRAARTRPAISRRHRDAVDSREPDADGIGHCGKSLSGHHRRDRSPFPSGRQPIVYQLTEVDSYIVGNNFYRTDVTIENISSVNQSPAHALPRRGLPAAGIDHGFGVAEPCSAPTLPASRCTLTATQPTPAARGARPDHPRCQRGHRDNAHPDLGRPRSRRSLADAALAARRGQRHRHRVDRSEASPPAPRRRFRGTP